MKLKTMLVLAFFSTALAISSLADAGKLSIQEQSISSMEQEYKDLIGNLTSEYQESLGDVSNILRQTRETLNKQLDERPYPSPDTFYTIAIQDALEQLETLSDRFNRSGDLSPQAFEAYLEDIRLRAAGELPMIFEGRHRGDWEPNFPKMTRIKLEELKKVAGNNGGIRAFVANMVYTILYVSLEEKDEAYASFKLLHYPGSQVREMFEPSLLRVRLFKSPEVDKRTISAYSNNNSTALLMTFFLSNSQDFSDYSQRESFYWLASSSKIAKIQHEFRYEQILETEFLNLADNGAIYKKLWDHPLPIHLVYKQNSLSFFNPADWGSKTKISYSRNKHSIVVKGSHSTGYDAITAYDLSKHFIPTLEELKSFLIEFER